MDTQGIGRKPASASQAFLARLSSKQLSLCANRILIRQELQFLDHLLRVMSGSPQGAYSRLGFDPVPQVVTTVDARA